MTDKERRFSPLVLAGDALLLLCAVPGLAGSFLSLYGSPGGAGWADTLGGAGANATVLDRCAAGSGLFLMYAVLFVLLSLAVWSLPRFQWAAAGGAAGLWALALWLNWSAVSSGAILTCKTIADQFASRVDWGRTFDYDTGLSLLLDTESTRLFLLFALALLALALGWAIIRARRWWIAVLLTLPPLLPGLLADLYPSWPPFLALCSCWCAMLLTSLCKWAAPSARGKLTLAALPAVAAVLLAITLAFPQEGYTRPAWTRKAQEALMNLTSHTEGFFSQWDGPFRRTVTYVGAAEEADLTHAGPLGYSGRTVLRVKSDYGGRLYLRGSSLAVYEDGVWKALPEGTYDEYSAGASSAVSPLYFPAMLHQDGPTYTVTVDNVGAVGSCVYAPYFPVPEVVEDTGALAVEDVYLARRQGLWTNTLSFVEREPTTGGDYFALTDGGQIAGFGLSDTQTAQYRDYVYSHYLDVPEGSWELLSGLFWQRYGYVPGDPVFTAQYVAYLLDDLCEYDPQTPAAPEGVDPVLYFLNDSRRGYCMHYASAATLMLRSLGIPTRYVSGFTVDSIANRQMDVPDRAAHAWVEVWVDGFGWYPVEVTPAAAFAWYAQGVAAIDDLPAVPTPEPLETPEPTLPPTPVPTPGQPSAQPSGVPLGPGGGEDSPNGGITIPPALLTAAKALAVLAGIAALLWLGQFLPKRYRAKRLSGPDHNRAALYAYGCLKRMERWGGRLDERAVELAQKAKFSQHTLTREELDELQGLVDLERERLCVILGPVMRTLCRYVWGMPPQGKKPGKFRKFPRKRKPAP